MRSLVAVLATLLSALAILACTTKPIPLRAARGATFVFPIASDYAAFTVGFTSETLGHEDGQFGRTVFRLTPETGGCTQPITLSPRWITRAWADPASPAGISGSLGLGGAGSSQVLAVLDVPATACVGRYGWSIHNELGEDVPVPLGPPIEGDLFRSVGGLPAGVGSFEIVAAAPASQPNPLEAYVPVLGTYPLNAHLKQLIPYHRIVWSFMKAGGPRPAAGDVTFLFPAAKMVVKTVFEERGLGRGSIVRWCVAGPGCRPDSNPADGLGELDVLFVDPDAMLEGIAIAFDLVDAETTGPMWGSDLDPITGFRATGVRLFDRDGADITTGFWWGLTGIS